MTEAGEEFPNPKRGFAGLGALTTDISQELAKAEELSRAIPHHRPQERAGSADHPTYDGAVKSIGRNKVNLVILAGIVGVIAIFVASYNGLSPPNPLPRRGYTQALKTQPFQPPTQQDAPLDNQSSIAEERPPVGTEVVLNANQLRYCLSEGIRLDAGRRLLNTRSNVSVDQFNTLVNDYNMRCGSFRYRKSDMTSVTRQVESNRPALEAEGGARFIQ